MSVNITNAIAAYSKVAKAPEAPAPEAGASAGGVDFAGLVKAAASTAIEQSKQAEELQKQAVLGKADIRDVVTAVQNAELTLETVVAVRDKVVAAYQDIIRMPI